jgi:hypothetical protein
MVIGLGDGLMHGDGLSGGWNYVMDRIMGIACGSRCAGSGLDAYARGPPFVGREEDEKGLIKGLIDCL